MQAKKKVLAIIGSTKEKSSNLNLVLEIGYMSKDDLEIDVFDSVSKLPHFNPDLDNDNCIQEVIDFRKKIQEADGVIVSSPEYVFSLPGSLKNALEWCVSSIVFYKKPVGLITAAASGEMAHEQLIMIMKTLDAKFDTDTTLHIRGIKGKFDAQFRLNDEATLNKLLAFKNSFIQLMVKK
jgi:chromate reductase, NAD(P)H dehydrogenase (quinone)